MSHLSRQTLPESVLVGGDTIEVGQAPEQHLTLADVVRAHWTATETSPLAPGDLGDLEDLSLLDEIGRGGMGVVYRAVQRSLDRQVAVKLLDPRQGGFTPEQIERFHREVLLAASLNHPNVAHIHWVRRRDPLFYFVMEYVPGPSLADLLSTQSPPLEEVLRLLAQVCDGMAHAHERGVIHRDLKPGNVLVETPEKGRDRQGGGSPFGRAVLVDFGLAGRHGEASTTAAGLLMGTPAYMSPEQARGEPTDHRGDLYSLGVVIFEAVTGRVPFSAPTPIAMAMRHISDAPPDPRGLVPSLHPDLADLITSLLQKAPEARLQSAVDVRDRLLAVLAEEQGARGGRATGEAPGLAQRDVTVLAVTLDGFAAMAHDQAFARTSFLLESWMDLVERTVAQHAGAILGQDAALLTCVFNFPEKAADHADRAVAALRDLCVAMRAFNRTHGRNLAFTAGLETGPAFAGQLRNPVQRLCFGTPLDTAVRLSQVRHCGIGLVGPQLSAALGESIPLEPLIGVAEDLGTASRVAPAYLART